MKNKLLSILSPEQLQSELKVLGSVVKVAKKYKLNTGTVYAAYKLVGINPFVRTRKVETLFNKEQ